MVDGPGNNGIDAIVYDEKSKHLDVFQFKFPGTIKNVGSDIPVEDIQKTLSRYHTLVIVEVVTIKCYLVCLLQKII